MVKDGYKVDETFLGHLKGVFQVLALCVANFKMLPGKRENSSFASIASDKEDKGFPVTTIVAFI